MESGLFREAPLFDDLGEEIDVLLAVLRGGEAWGEWVALRCWLERMRSVCRARV